MNQAPKLIKTKLGLIYLAEQLGNVSAAGVFEKVVNIYGYDVTIRGAVVGGVPRIGTAFIP